MQWKAVKGLANDRSCTKSSLLYSSKVQMTIRVLKQRMLNIAEEVKADILSCVENGLMYQRAIRGT